MQHRVFLVPGFFGFSSIGGMRYFRHVHRALGGALRDRGLEVSLHDVDTLPTASLERRAGRLAEVVARVAGPTDPIHIVGHSTGGVDGRVLLSPQGEITATAEVLDAWMAARPNVRTVVSVAAPHTGAPIARFFGTAQGERWLRLLSLLTLRVVRLGSIATLPAHTLARLRLLGRRAGEPESGLLDDVWKDVLRDFDPERRAQLQSFFGEVWQDRSLLRQLVPARMRPLDAALVDREGVRYGSVVLRARAPDGAGLGLRDRVHPSHQLYKALHRLAGLRRPPADRGPRLPLVQQLGEAPRPRDNDAIVPTLAQLHGELIHASRADHLDVIGYFNGPAADPPHVDWLRSRSRYDRADFAATWQAVAAFLAGRPQPVGYAPPPPPGGPG